MLNKYFMSERDKQLLEDTLELGADRMHSVTHLYLGSTQDRDERQEFSSLQQPQPNREVNPRKQVTSGRMA